MVKRQAEVKEGNKKRKREPLALNKGAWTAKEDQKLVEYIAKHGDKNWNTLPAKAELNRCGKSCRLRWLNYLRPGIKRGNISEEEEDLIIRLHNLIGNRWSLIAGRLPGRTDNEIKNHWNTHLSKRCLSIHELNSKNTTQTAATGGGACIDSEKLQYCDDPCAAVNRCLPEHMSLHSPAGDQQLLYVMSSGAGEPPGIGDYDVTGYTNYEDDYLFDTWSISFVDQLYW